MFFFIALLSQNQIKMNKKLLSLLAIFLFAIYFGQTNFWTPFQKNVISDVNANKKSIIKPNLFNLDIDGLKRLTANSPKKNKTSVKSNIIISFPDGEGNMQDFSIFKTSNFSPELEVQHPEITSYYGESVNGKSSKIYFSISPLGFYSMQLRLGKEAVFIESYDKNNTSYIVYKKSDKSVTSVKFNCGTKEKSSAKNGLTLARTLSADDGKLRTYRLALSCTGEYTQYFGGTKASALAAMNNTMTRVNGVFENDFAIKLEIIPNNSNIIFTSATSDPYSNASTGANGAWNTELMNVLHGTTYGIGDAAFDIGHLFGATGGGGNAGCIGCVCNNSTTYDSAEQWYWYKGQGFTSPADGIPTGDNFDIDYVAHEIGHQFGANHTWTHDGNEGTGVQVEPGSGSTIMGYAGITSMDVQAHSDAYFHAVSIEQITNYMKSTAGSCSTNSTTGNPAPLVNAGSDYTIPKSTPFMLTGTATDTNGDTLSYIWEQMDPQTNTTAPNATKTSGVNFRSWNPTSSPTRYLPIMTSVLAGSTTTAGKDITVEALSSVTRNYKFRFTVRDNKANGAANAYDDMVVSVNSTYGPLTVTSQNTTGITYPQGSLQTVTWNVAKTNTLSPNVDILISTDGGNTWTTILTATANDGTEAVTIPNILSSTCRFMIKASSSIFFNVNTQNFAISAPDNQAPTAPTLSASGTTSISTVLTWTGATDNVAVTSYDIYKDDVLIGNSTTSTFNVTGLTPSTTYVFTVKAKDAAGNVSSASNSVSINTLPPDTQSPTAPTLSASGTTNNATNLSWSGATDNMAVASYDIYKDGVFIGNSATSPFTVTGLSASTTYVFTVKAKDEAGNISSASNSVSVTTLAAPSATELYISEYYEGTGNDKVLEISNPTLNDIVLSSYSVKKQPNGSGAWSNQLNLSGTIKANSTLVLENKSSTLSCTFTSQTVAAAPLDFNGDDPVALFKNGTLIDVVGTFNQAKIFGKDVDLRRKVNIPNTTYTESEWDSFAITTSNVNCDNIGIVNPLNNLAVNNPKAQSDLIILPNPVKGDTLYVKNVKNNSDFEIIDATGKIINKGKITNESINVRNINSGVYFIKIGEAVKRFIKE